MRPLYAAKAIKEVSAGDMSLLPQDDSFTMYDGYIEVHDRDFHVCDLSLLWFGWILALVRARALGASTVVPDSADEAHGPKSQLGRIFKRVAGDCVKACARNVYARFDTSIVLRFNYFCRCLMDVSKEI